LTKKIEKKIAKKIAAILALSTRKVTKPALRGMALRNVAKKNKF
jgi:hypothetical protein